MARYWGPDLGSELLDVVNEDELREFIDELTTRSAQTAGIKLASADRRRLLNALARVAVETLPTLNPLLPHRPTTPASGARVYGLEIEGMSHEDRDYEIAHQFVLFAQRATAAMASAPLRGALARAASEHAPGLQTGPLTAPPRTALKHNDQRR